MPVLRGTVATTTDIRGTIKMKPLIPFPFEFILILFSLYGPLQNTSPATPANHLITVTEKLIFLLAIQELRKPKFNIPFLRVDVASLHNQGPMFRWNVAPSSIV